VVGAEGLALPWPAPPASAGSDSRRFSQNINNILDPDIPKIKAVSVSKQFAL